MTRLMPLWVSLIVLLGALWIRLEEPLPVLTIRHLAFDAYQRWSPREYQPLPVRILDIDEESLLRLGQWPWPRTLLANLVGRLSDMGVATVAFDMLFAEPDRTSPSFLLHALEKSGTVTPAELANLLAGLPDHDEIFAKRLATAPVVSGFSLSSSASANDLPPTKFGVATAGGDPAPFLVTAASALTSLPIIDRAAAGLGSFSFLSDTDGVVRRVPLLVSIRGKIYPSFALETLRVAQGAKSYVIKSIGDESQAGFGAQTGVTDIKVGAFAVPTDAAGRLWVRYTSHTPERFIPIWKVLDDQPDAVDLEGFIVLVGASAAGLRDQRFGPLGELVPGVEIQAQIIEQILSGDFLSRPDWADGAEILLMLALGLLVPILTYRFGAWSSALVAGVFVAAAVGISVFVFHRSGLLIDPIYPALSVVWVYMAVSLLRYAQTEREKRWIRNAFRHYVSPNLVEQVIAHHELLKLGGERRELSFVFTDLEGFTPLVEHAAPGELIPLLNEYLNEMIQIGFRHGGTLDAIIGDATTFFFNAPLDQPDHPQQALDCALEMDQFAQSYSQRMRMQGYPLGLTRIGVHTGTVTVGNMGGDVLFNYCAHGDAINTAARLETVNKHLGTRICVSASTALRCTAFSGRPVGRLVLKGKSEPIETFEPLSCQASGAADSQVYSRAFATLDSDEEKALESFAELARRYPDDPLVRFHLSRLERGNGGTTIAMSEK